MRRLITIDLRNATIDLFESYENIALPLVAKHGGRVELRVRAVDGSSETHLLHFPDAQAYEAYRSDPERLAARDIWRASGAALIAQDVEVVA